MPFFVGEALLAHANAGCYRCGRGDDLIDMDAQIVGEGALVLCKGCIAEAAEAAKLTFNGALVRELNRQLEEANARAFDATRRETAFIAALDAALEASTSEQCGATTASGRRCKNDAIDDGRCKIHATGPKPLVEVLK